MNMKILSPAGDFESLKMAVFNGANEVYLGVKDFNARNIEGFSLTSLKEAVDFAHIFDVKVNLAVNILFKDEEMQSALDLIVDAYNLGVDYFIIQDIGLMDLLHTYFPQIVIHASTQMGLHNLEGVKEVEKLGVKRVVLARETPINEIKRIKENSKVEIEYFCQGALCVSFSGNCYMSSYLHDASGNRGKCKQLCRLPYSFRFNNKEIKNGYLLSAKDIKMLNNLQDLKDAGVDVLKIEGRARRPYYVGVATSIYKNVVQGLEYKEEDLELAFTRGYTAGYFNGNGEIISNKQNHVGIEIGKVEKFKKGKKFNEIFISSNREISPKSVLKFFNKEQEVVLTAYDIQKVRGLYRITTTQLVSVGTQVNLISDFEKEQTLLNTAVRRKFDVKIIAKENQKIKACININSEDVVVEGETCAPALTSPLTKEEFKTNFNKSDLFEIELDCEIKNVFLPKQKLNEFRRKVVEKIKEKLTENKNKKIKKIILNSQKINKKCAKIVNFQEIFNKNEKLINKNIIYSPEIYELNDIKEFKNRCTKENKNAYLNLPIFALNEDITLLKEIIEKTKVGVVVNNLYALDFNTEKIIGGGLNVYNSYSATFFSSPYLQAEDNSYIMPYMTLLHCPIKNHLKADCKNCPYQEGYEYVMQNGKRFKLRRIKMSNCVFQLTE